MAATSSCDSVGALSQHLGQRVWMTPGALNRLGAALTELDLEQPLLVVDPGVVEAGHLETALQALGEKAGRTRVFSEVSENPTDGDIQKASRELAGERFDCIIGLGGGSAMDIAKGLNFLLSNGGRMEDYQGYGKASRPMLPSIGIPTTAGTGSEAQSYAVVVRDEDHSKMACGDAKARFKAVILDSDLISSAPGEVQAAAGMDALSHALESFVCNVSTPVSRLFSRKAWCLMERSLENSVLDRVPLAAQDVLQGSYLAGIAIERSMLGAAHACANPLTARYGIRHGIAIGLVLPQVVHFNGENGAARYDRIGDEGEAQACGATIEERVRDLRRVLGMPTSLSAIGVQRRELSELSRAAALQWTGRFNPVEVTAQVAEQIYEGCFE